MIKIIYNHIKKNESTEVTFERLIYKFVNSIGYAKTYISLIVLKELGPIREESGVLSLADNKKTDLTNSDTFKTISEAGE